MSLVRYTTPRWLRLFDNLESTMVKDFSASPRIDIKEDDEKYEITADLPGFQSDQIDISIHPSNKYLDLKASHEAEGENEKEENGAKYIHRERIAQTFSRRIGFRTPVDTSKATTSYKDGVLTIVLPKSEEAKPVKLSL